MEQLQLILQDSKLLAATAAFAAVGAAFVGVKVFSFLKTLLELYALRGIPVRLFLFTFYCNDTDAGQH